ncbi:MAG: hypothetical protein IJW58_04605 [Clostridia bacterium]|nr:hypothetical protein [Clostridia bacterium]
MKKFSVGLPIQEKSGFFENVIKNKDRIKEVYFSWGGFKSGRSAQTENGQLPYWEAQQRFLENLRLLHRHGIVFNLLFNANCYGEESLARSFFYEIGDTIEYATKNFCVESVTTTSPLIAKFVKANFPSLKTRASVNMEIGTKEGMEYLFDYFDGFYLKRELNKSLADIKRARKYCDENGKELYLLANSGCLNYCSAHNFHDNLVAHEKEIAKYDNAYLFDGVCTEFLKKRSEKFLERTNFVRPEDLPLVEEYFDGIKLATRVNSNPNLVLDSYLRGKYSGSIPDLLEPNHSGLFYPKVIENGKIPKEYFSKVLTCDKDCATCGYCEEISKKSTIILEKEEC